MYSLNPAVNTSKQKGDNNTKQPNKAQNLKQNSSDTQILVGKNLILESNFLWDDNLFRNSMTAEDCSMLLQCCLLTRNTSTVMNVWLLYMNQIESKLYSPSTFNLVVPFATASYSKSSNNSDRINMTNTDSADSNVTVVASDNTKKLLYVRTQLPNNYAYTNLISNMNSKPWIPNLGVFNQNGDNKPAANHVKKIEYANATIKYSENDLSKIEESAELLTYLSMALVCKPYNTYPFSFINMKYMQEWNSSQHTQTSLGAVWRSCGVSLWTNKDQVNELIEKTMAMALISASSENSNNVQTMDKHTSKNVRWLNQICNHEIYKGKLRLSGNSLVNSFVFATNELGGNTRLMLQSCLDVIEHNYNQHQINKAKPTEAVGASETTSNTIDNVNEKQSLRPIGLKKSDRDKLKASDLKVNGGCVLTEIIGQHQTDDQLKFIQRVEFAIRNQK